MKAFVWMSGTGHSIILNAVCYVRRITLPSLNLSSLAESLKTATIGATSAKRACITPIVIVPVTDDAAWLQRFENLPTLQMATSSVLLLAPHPDDEVLGAGALIATLRERGTPVTVVAATDGENAYDTTATERTTLGVTRAREQQEALATLGVEASSIKRLRLTDSGLAALECELKDHLMDLVDSGMTLLAPWAGDFHPDHEACARAAASVAKAKGVPLISYFFWTWHRGEPSLLDSMSLVRFDPGSEALRAKASALNKHASQLESADGEPILPDRLLGPARWPFEVFLSHE